MLKFVNGILIDSSDYQIAVRGVDTTLQANQTANFTASWGNVYAVDASASSISVILPASSTPQSGNTIIIRRIDTSANDVTVYANGIEVFDTTHTSAIALQLKAGGSTTIRCTGTKPAIVGWSNPKNVSRLWTPDGLTRAIDIDFTTPSIGALSTIENTGTLGGNATQATGTNQPIIDDADASGIRGCSFDGVDDYLTSSNIWELGQTFALFCVFRYNSFSNAGSLFSDGFTGDSNVSYIMGVNSLSGTWVSANRFGAGYYNGAWRSSVGSTRYTAGSVGFAYGARDSSNQLVTSVYGETPILVAQLTDVSTTTVPTNIGGAWSNPPNGRANARIFRILGFSSNPSISDIASLEGWAAWKFGRTTELPTEHTYKNVPPIITIVSY